MTDDSNDHIGHRRHMTHSLSEGHPHNSGCMYFIASSGVPGYAAASELDWFAVSVTLNACSLPHYYCSSINSHYICTARTVFSIEKGLKTQDGYQSP